MKMKHSGSVGVGRKPLHDARSFDGALPLTDAKPVPEPLCHIREFCAGVPFMLLTFLASAMVISLGIEVPGVVFFVFLISALLVICDDLLVLLFPFLAACISVLQCYDSFDTFIRFAFLAVIPIGALIFHFVYYKTSFRIGKSFSGLVAVAVAVTLGGLFSISTKEYFSPTALYYTLMLGIGMVGIYLLLKSQPRREEGRSERFVLILFLMGMLACFHMFEIYVECMTQNGEVWGAARGIDPSECARFADGMTFSDFVAEFKKNGIFKINSSYFGARLQPSNNLSTFLLISMPTAFLLSMKKSRLFLLSVPITLTAIFLARSRGGIVMAAIEFFFCLLFMALGEKKGAVKGIFIGATALYLLLGIYVTVKIALPSKLISIIAGRTEVRACLIFRSLEDFEEAPLFGKGLGNTANSDLYNGRAGTLPWYHMMIPQIIGSMGTLGIVAYTFRLVTQLRLVWQKRNLMTAMLALSYLGLLLMSQVNPGEFCPLPYGLLATIIFIMIEEEPDAKSNRSEGTQGDAVVAVGIEKNISLSEDT